MTAAPTIAPRIPKEAVPGPQLRPPPVWTNEIVKEWVAEALDTLRRLPDRERGWVYGQKSQWPDVWQSAADAFAVDVQRVGRGERTERERREADAINSRGPASAIAISRLDCVIHWFKALDRREAQIVILTAQGVRHGLIRNRTGLGRTSVHRIQKAGLNKIATALNNG